MKVAAQHKDVNFAVASKYEFQHELNEYGIDYVACEKPTITAKNAKGQKFIAKEEFSWVSIRLLVHMKVMILFMYV